MEEELLRVSGVVEESIVDGPGYRFTVFTQGCPHFCPGCHNPQTHDVAGGDLIHIDKLFRRIKHNPMLRGITFSGGEPFLQARVLASLAERVHKELHLDVITYTGYTYEYLFNDASEENGWLKLLSQTDYLIDGPFMIERKSLLLPFRGSENQRIIDIKASDREARVVVIDHF